MLYRVLRKQISLRLPYLFAEHGGVVIFWATGRCKPQVVPNTRMLEFRAQGFHRRGTLPICY